MATMKDVALAANVSVSTVSYVINGNKNISDEVKNRVFQVIRDLDYKPNRTAQNLARSSTRIIGLYGPGIEGFSSNAFFYDLLSGILSVTTKQNYNLIVYPEERNEEGEFCISLDHGEPIDGAIIINPRITNNYLQKIIDKKMSFVLVGRPSEFKDLINYVDTDNIAVGYNAVKTLVLKDYSDILLLNGPENYTISMDRLEGYKMAFSEFGLKFDKDLVINSELTIEAGYEAVKKCLQKGMKFTAIIASSDVQAIGVLNCLNDHNYRIPKDVAVICASETFMTANYNPKISGIDINAKEIGFQAATQLISILEKQLINPSYRIVPFKMNLRDTT